MRAFYTLLELAALVGISRFAIHRLLRRRGVPIDRSCRPNIVSTADLQLRMPDVCESITLAKQMGAHRRVRTHYTAPQLARALNKSGRTVRRMFERTGARIDGEHPKILWLADLCVAFPDIWKSMFLSAGATDSP